MGVRSTQLGRCKATLTSQYKPILILSEARKDHKPCTDPIKGPKQRPICRAKNSPNGHLGNFVTQTLRGVSDKLSYKLMTESGSIKEVPSTISDCNAKIKVYLDRLRKTIPIKVKEDDDNKM